MLRFSVFDEQGPARTCPLVNAHLLGADDTALPGAVAFKNGMVVCKPEDPHPAHALSLEVDAGKAGSMMLQTCLLQQRDEPYRFYQELARHRIKIFLEKSENWGLLDPAKAPEAFDLFERARSMFVTGMVEQDPFRAEMNHRDALAIAIFGGTAQFVVTWLIGVVGSPLVPACYMAAALAVSISAMLALRIKAAG